MQRAPREVIVSIGCHPEAQRAEGPRLLVRVRSRGRLARLDGANDNSIAPLLLSVSPESRSRDAKAPRASVPCADSARKKMSARYQSTDAIRGSTTDELTCRLERLSVDLIQRSEWLVEQNSCASSGWTRA